MFRALLSLVLVPILALPHGMCFCHYVEAAPFHVEPNGDTCEAPATPAESPDDHDADCPCKLREVAADNTATIEVTRNLDLVQLACDVPAAPPSADVVGQSGTHHFKADHESRALIPCALRI